MESALRSTFDACDDDADGFISLSQLRSALEATGLADVDSILGGSDLETEHVSYDDFREAVRRLEESLTSRGVVNEEDGDDEETDCRREASVASTASRDDGFFSSSTTHESSPDVDGRTLEAAAREGGGADETTPKAEPEGSSTSRSMTKMMSTRRLVSQLQKPDHDVAEEERRKYEKTIEDLLNRLEKADEDRTRSAETHSRLQNENKQLIERLYHVEEQLRDFETSKAEALDAERKRRNADVARVESEKNAEIEALTSREQTLDAQVRRMEKREREYQVLASKTRKETQRLRSEMHEARVREDDVASKFKSEIDALTRDRDEGVAREEALRGEIHQLAEAAQLQSSFRIRSMSVDEPDAKLLDEIRRLKARVSELQESNNELRSQFIQQGQAMIEEGSSLAAEMETASKDDLMKRIKDVADAYQRLRIYTEGLLFAVITKSPELLEKGP